MKSEITLENLRRKNFAPKEFVDSETAKRLKIQNIPNQAQLNAGLALADKLQELSDKLAQRLGYRVAITINSAFRSLKLNKAIGGAPMSFHMQFLAADINIERFEPHESVLLIKECGVSFDKVFVERGCVHVQTHMNDQQNQNIFGTAYKNKNGEWEVTKFV